MSGKSQRSYDRHQWVGVPVTEDPARADATGDSETLAAQRRIERLALMA